MSRLCGGHARAAHVSGLPPTYISVAFTGKSGPFSYNNDRRSRHAQRRPTRIHRKHRRRSCGGTGAPRHPCRSAHYGQIEPDEPDDWIAKARAYARPKVMEEGWSDADIDRIIKEERRAVQPQNG